MTITTAAMRATILRVPGIRLRPAHYGREKSRLGRATHEGLSPPKSPASVPARISGERMMMDYQPYVEHLNELVRALVQDDRSATTFNAEAVNEALNDGAPEALRSMVTLQDRRDAGAFFTGSRMADLAWAPLLPTIDESSIIVDPACGAGSLLIPPLRALLPSDDPLRVAGQLRGCDFESIFIEAARARLTLAVASSQPSLERLDLGNLRFPGLQQGDALTQMERLLEGATHIALNPPYNEIIAPEGCTWASGEINHAALFTEVTVRHMPTYSRMVVILPKMLRRGPRYAKWREAIRQMADIDQVTPWGVHDSHTHVDVFLMYLTKRGAKQVPIPRVVTVTELAGKRPDHEDTSSDTPQASHYPAGPARTGWWRGGSWARRRPL
jgi:hypothetical protein